MKGVLIFILIFIFSSKLFAQESCTEKLYKANNLYEKGQITEAIEIANSCANITNSKSEQWQAYRLLAMAYLVNNQTTEARKAAEKMLDLNPTYKPSYLKDPIELINLLKSVKIIPKFSIGMAATVGLNFTKPRITGIYNGTNAPKVYSTKNNWQAGIMLGYNFNEYTSLHSGLLATSKNYDINYKFENFGSVTVNEQMTYLDIPLFTRFTLKPVKGFRFFTDAGAFVGRFISGQSDFYRIVDENNNSISTQNLNSEARKRKWEYGVLGGIGSIYSFRKLNVALDCRYYRSFANITNKDNRYKNENLFYDYYYIDDDLKLDNLTISLSFIYHLNYRVVKM